MDADLDTLATALDVRIDELLKQAPQLVPCRPAVGIAPKLSDDELVTLAVMQALLGFTSEARWLHHGHHHQRHLFPYLGLLPLAVHSLVRHRQEPAQLVGRDPLAGVDPGLDIVGDPLTPGHYHPPPCAGVEGVDRATEGA